MSRTADASTACDLQPTPDTIFALSTPPGKGGIAIMRVSGPDATKVAATLTGIESLKPRYATYCTIAHGHGIDRGVVILFQGPASYTGEDIVEFQVHGGRAITNALADALASLGCRPADPGEFTKRAYLNGRIDLTEAEAIADLIDAETQAQHEQALQQAEGGLHRLYENWAGRLTKAVADLEASLDFADEELPELRASVSGQVKELLHEITLHCSDARRGERLREGIRIAILGAPNAGKSSLLNTLAGRDVAIVSPHAGTTRDVLEVHLNMGGYPVLLADTAGLREATDPVEAEGIARARRWGQQADINLLLVAPDAQSLDTASYEIIDERTIVVFTKADLALSYPKPGLSISVKDGSGIDVLLQALASRVSALAGMSFQIPPTRERHRLLLQNVMDDLARYLGQDEIELAAEDLRSCLRHLGELTGHVGSEALLDVIFRDFCIGK